MPPDEKGAPPAGHGSAPQKIIAVDNSDGPDTTLSVDRVQLRPRDVHPDEIPELRSLWWNLASAGHRLPAELDIILIPGGAS